MKRMLSDSSKSSEKLSEGKKPTEPDQQDFISTENVKELLLEIYARLRRHFGYRNWWPGETEFEIILGAILTQNTSWKNVEKALDNLKKQGLLEPEKLRKVEQSKLEELIKPSGYYRQKAERIQRFLDFFFAPPVNGKIELLKALPLKKLRKMLLEIKGIGPETADSILLYALNKPIFVVDAYTKRIFSRLRLVKENISYDELREFFEKNLPRSVKLYNDYHAQLVELGKNYCKKIPDCSACPLRSLERCREKQFS